MEKRLFTDNCGRTYIERNLHIEGILPDFYSEAELVEHQRISREKNPDDFCHGSAFRSEPIYEKVPFVLNKGYDTQKLDYYKCSTCGEVKSN